METLTLLDRPRPAAILRSATGIPLIWLGRALTRRRLRDLDDRALADDGLTPDARDHECALWPWQGRRLRG